jgi:hypothetical protein
MALFDMFSVGPTCLLVPVQVPLFLAAFFVVVASLARSLRPLDATPVAHLPRMTPLSMLDAAARALGRRTLWVLALLSSLFAAALAWTSMWWDAAFFAFGAALFAVQLWRLRRS